MTLNTVNIDNRDWTWTTDLTLSLYRDRWKERDPNWKPAAYQRKMTGSDPCTVSYLTD